MKAKIKQVERITKESDISKEIKELILQYSIGDWNRRSKHNRYEKKIYIALRCAHYLKLIDSFREIQKELPVLYDTLLTEI